MSVESSWQTGFAEDLRALPGVQVNWLANANGLLDLQHEDWTALIAVHEVGADVEVWIDAGYREIQMNAGEAQAVMHALATDAGRVEVTRSVFGRQTVVLIVSGPLGEVALTRPLKYPLKTWEQRRVLRDPG